jgi:hypothetical protein
MKARIGGIETYRITLETSLHLGLKECLYVFECARDLMSMSKLDVINFKFVVGEDMF